MNRELIEILLFAGGGLLAIIQWFLKKWVDNLEKSIESLQEAQKEIDAEVNSIKNTYAPRADIKEIKDEIISRLTRIENYLLDRNKDV